MVNLSNGLTALSLLSGSDAFSAATAAASAIKIESKDVRAAKALFTATPTTPPWDAKGSTSTGSLSSQVSSVLAMRTIIDRGVTVGDQLDPDVQTSFIAYKALDRLRVLSESASATTTSDAQRATLQKAFAKGLTDLQTFLGQAPTDKVNLAFAQANRLVKTVAVQDPFQYSFSSTGLVKNRTDALPGLTGNEVFTIALSSTRYNDKVTVDLSQGPQPPTVDSVINAFNAAIQAVPARNPDGTIALDDNGNPQARWRSHFEAEKQGDKWGMKLVTPGGLEHLTLDQVGAKDALVVTTGQTALDSPTATTVFRIDDPTGAATRKSMATVAALDTPETERAKLLGKTTTISTAKTGDDGKVTIEKTTTSNVYADTNAAGTVTDAEGNTYVVGTTKGDLGAMRSDGDDNLFLTKLNGEGKVVWQRSLGAAGSSTGAAISMAPDGNIVVAGTVNGAFNNMSTDGDMFVTKFSPVGDEAFSTVVRSAGADTAKAVAVGADGSIYVGGRLGRDGGDGAITRLTADGKIAERRIISGATDNSESVTGLAVDGDGNLLALVSNNGVAELRKMSGSSLATDLGSLTLGTADARAIAVGPDGTIVVGGATSAPLSGTQVNATGGGRDGFVARIDAGLGSASVTYLATSESDQVDSVAFLGNDLYVGGRTTGALGAAKSGSVDGFVSRIDMASGAIVSTNQFGTPLQRTEPVRVAADVGGANALSAIGFARGAINPVISANLTTQTALRAGDAFSIQVDGGAVRKVTIDKNETMTSLADKLRWIVGSKALISTPKTSEGRSLGINVKAGHSIQLMSGPAGADALAKLGLDPQRVATPDTVSSSAPKVQPGGTYGLGLSDALSIKTADAAKMAFKKIESALSMTQTAYRSLYWDDGKAAMVDAYNASKTGKSGGTVSAYQQAQLKNYQAALQRLTAGSGTQA